MSASAAVVVSQQTTGGGGSRPPASRPQGALTDMLRAAIAPILSAAILVGLLSAWVATGGAGTLRRVRVEIGLAAIPLPLTPGAGVHRRDVTTYLAIRNLGGGDELLGGRSPLAAKVLLVRDGRRPFARDAALTGIQIPANGSLNLNPFSTDIVLIHPADLRAGQVVPLTLRFRNAGTIRVDLTVTTSLASPQ